MPDCQDRYPECVWPIQGCVWSIQGCVWSIQGCVQAFQGCVWSIQGCVQALQGCVQALQGCVQALQGCVWTGRHETGHHDSRRIAAIAGERRYPTFSFDLLVMARWSFRAHWKRELPRWKLPRDSHDAGRRFVDGLHGCLGEAAHRWAARTGGTFLQECNRGCDYLGNTGKTTYIPTGCQSQGAPAARRFRDPRPPFLLLWDIQHGPGRCGGAQQVLSLFRDNLLSVFPGGAHEKSPGTGAAPCDPGGALDKQSSP